MNKTKRYSLFFAIGFLMALAMTLCSAIALADSPTRIAVATRTNQGENIIRVYNGQGELVGDVPIASEFLLNRFIAADFIPDSLASVVTITEDESGRLRGSFINDQGEVVNRVFFGANIRTLMAIYYDGDSVADLAVIQGIGNAQVATVYLRPALSGESEKIEVPLGGRRDIVRLLMSDGDEIGTVSRVDSLSPNKKQRKKQQRLKRRLRKLTKKRNRFEKRNTNGKFDKRIANLDAQIDRVESQMGGANSIRYLTRTGSQQNLSIEADPGKFLSFANGNDLGFVKVKNKRVEIFGNGLPTTILEKQIADRVFVGDYLNEGSNSAVVITGEEGAYRVVNPRNGLVENRVIDITVPSNAPTPPDPDEEDEEEEEEEEDDTPTESDIARCATYTELYQEFIQAVNERNFPLATDLAQQLNALRPSLPEGCDPAGGGFNPGGGSGGGGSGGGSGGGNDEPDTVFTNGVDRFVPQFYFFKSNTGDFLGICDRFLDAPDGPGDFLAKNSDGGGIVWLTPDGSYDGDSGMILDFNTLKTRVASLRYTGIANGGRGHYRLGGDLSDFGKHVFTAVTTFTGERHCWKINPKGRDRVD